MSSVRKRAFTLLEIRDGVVAPEGDPVLLVELPCQHGDRDRDRRDQGKGQSSDSPPGLMGSLPEVRRDPWT